MWREIKGTTHNVVEKHVPKRRSLNCKSKPLWMNTTVLATVKKKLAPIRWGSGSRRPMGLRLFKIRIYKSLRTTEGTQWNDKSNIIYSIRGVDKKPETSQTT
ncbi:hypothetical protein ElyMa_003700800 [Elysia marginata]|uniref:Uncharacterized protein n=1 Tax=Elysia marginata TaxID=1093978 RepID=A0AAV4F377_9GAST|nr:hypothetical protein ElyMa_003700800 [Elysia marginata]